jgi:hypothetical protein
VSASVLIAFNTSRLPKKEEKYRIHAWGAIGYDFKSELVWYNVPNSNGAITQKAYREQILDSIVLPWLEKGDQFIIEEEGASGHHGLEARQ